MKDRRSKHIRWWLILAGNMLFYSFPDFDDRLFALAVFILFRLSSAKITEAE